MRKDYPFFLFRYFLPLKFFLKRINAGTFIFLSLLLFTEGFSQPTFMKMYNNGNIGYAVREVNASSYVVAGGTDFYFNYHWSLMSSIPTTDIHFFKTDLNGNLMWEKVYSSITSRSIARWFEPTQDGGYIITGYESSETIWPPDSNNVVLIKTDGNGVITWSKVYDSGKDELAFCVRQTTDGGYIVSGFHDSAPVSVFGNAYVLLIKTDANGNTLWVKKHQLAVRDLFNTKAFPYVVRQTANGGYVVVGTTLGSHAADVYVIRTDGNGDLVWANSYEHDNTAFRFSVGMDIIESASGDFIIAGSMDKDRVAMQFNYPYILKISSAGAFIDAGFYETNPLLFWQSGFSSVEQTADGGFFFTGMGGYANFGDQAQLLKTDVNFTTQWSRVYSWDGLATMGSQCGRQTSDGGYVFAGKKQFDGTVLLKTDFAGLIPCKNPTVLVEYVPGIIVQNKIPLNFPLMNSNNLLLTTLTPLFDTATSCQIFTLPIELSYFSATPLPEKQVQLDWTTSSEINNDYFIVERSADGKSFEEAGKINAAGNSTGILNYGFTDHNPFPANLSYYRLRQVDYNGAFGFSKTVPVKFHSNNFELVSAFADYNNSQIKIYFYNDSKQSITYSIADAFGKTICSGSRLSARGVDEILIDGKNLSSGIYFYTLSNGYNTLAGKIFY